MTKRQTERYLVLRRVRDLVTTQRGRLQATPAAAAQLAALSAVVRQLEDSARQQLRSAQSHYRVRVRVRRDLVQQLTLFAQTARVLERLTPDPLARETFRLFKVPRPQTDAGLQAAAALFLDKAAPITSRFADYGVSRDRLRQALAAFTRAVQRGDRARGDSAAAMAAIDAALKDGATALAGLDVIVRHAWQHDPGLRAAWARTRGWQPPRQLTLPAERSPEPASDKSSTPHPGELAADRVMAHADTTRRARAIDLSLRRLQQAGIPIALDVSTAEPRSRYPVVGIAALPARQYRRSP